MPSILAVLRLTISSTFVTCCTGIAAFRPAIVDGDVLALDVSSFLQSLAEGSNIVRISLRPCAIEESYHRHNRLLRERPKRPQDRCAPEERYEIASLHCLPRAVLRIQFSPLEPRKCTERNGERCDNVRRRNPEWSMTAWGQIRSSDDVRRTTALTS